VLLWLFTFPFDIN